MISSGCQKCLAPIFWAKTPAGKAMPLDREPNLEKGNIYLEGEVARVITKEERAAWALAGTMPVLYLSHFATCSHAASFRKKK